MQERIALSTAHFESDELQFITAIFQEKNNFWQNSIVDFEADLEQYFGEKALVTALNSGTAGLHLGLLLLDVKPGDEVLCQTMTFAASANVIRYVGATPVFIDSENTTWNLCPKTLEIAIKDRIEKGRKPKAIIAVHLFGMPYQVDAIHAVANKYEIPVLEDSAEAFGSSYKGLKCGSFGEIGVLSFNNNKIVTTGGGGALITRSQKVKDKAFFLATQAKDPAPHYQHSEIGYNYRISPICAGIGKIQMQSIESRLQSRREMNQFYKLLFENIDGVYLFEEPNSDYYSNHWLTAIIIDYKKTSGKTAQQLRLHLEKSNIESRSLWKPMHLQPVFASYPYYGETIAEDLFENGLCLPSGSNLSIDDQIRISDVIHQFFN